MSTILVADIGGTTVKIGFVVDSTPQTYVRQFPTAELRNDHPVASLVRMIAIAIGDARLQPNSIVSTVPWLPG